MRNNDGEGGGGFCLSVCSSLSLFIHLSIAYLSKTCLVDVCLAAHSGVPEPLSPPVFKGNK